ncbi:GGDEF domain-containing protein [Chromobacterium violaceum]|uniref:GGDEF domain-containing protein n=1 Tax=Chromobacterium violaceum TaxID=536 RepID=UPI001B31E872|nr:GGDEF domain-containing protein [Chromobacterium violaceum]MBP4046534.1 GGDEF domain-containing protein [Chromobacterium violaceum]
MPHSASKQDDSKLLLDNLVELTSQREQEMLESSLLSTLVELMRVDKAELFACRWVNGAPYIRRRLEAQASSGKPVVRETNTDGWLPPPAFLYDLLNRVGRDDVVQRIPSGLCLPLRCMGNIIALVVIHCGSDSRINRDMLKAMTRIHENFLRLLFEADRDMLTALHNRRKFDLRFYNLIAALQHEPASTTPHVLALLDIDHFKRVNDQFGHMVGDEVLLLMAQLMQQSFREEDGLFRYGGEEFALLLQGNQPEIAEQALERFRSTVESHIFPQVGNITISIGHTRIVHGQLPDRLIEQADRALYYAKSHGRNQVRGYEQLEAGGELEAPPASSQVDYF